MVFVSPSWLRRERVLILFPFFLSIKYTILFAKRYGSRRTTERKKYLFSSLQFAHVNSIVRMSLSPKTNWLMCIYQNVFVHFFRRCRVQFNKRAAQKLKLINDSFAPSVVQKAHSLRSVVVTVAQQNLPKFIDGKYCLNYVNALECSASKKITHVIWNIVIIESNRLWIHMRMFFISLLFLLLPQVEECHSFVPFFECSLEWSWSRVAAVFH